jgi:hypothetical protein
MNPLSEPSRLRSWLLELARGSALAWSGSPQARSVPVPHGVSAEEMIDGAVVPAPASLRTGLARTFDRAAGTAALERAAQRQPVARHERTAEDVDARAAVAAGGPAAPPADLVPAGAPPADGDTVTTAAPPVATAGAAGPAGRGAATEPGGDDAYADPPTLANVLPLAAQGQYYADGFGAPLMPIGEVAGRRERSPDWRTRPAIAVAASLVVAVAGITAALNWPAPSTDPAAENFPAIIAPSRSASASATPTPTPTPSAVTPPVPTVVPSPGRPDRAWPPRLVTDNHPIPPTTAPPTAAAPTTSVPTTTGAPSTSPSASPSAPATGGDTPSPPPSHSPSPSPPVGGAPTPPASSAPAATPTAKQSPKGLSSPASPAGNGQPATV